MVEKQPVNKILRLFSLLLLASVIACVDASPVGSKRKDPAQGASQGAGSVDTGGGETDLSPDLSPVDGNSGTTRRRRRRTNSPVSENGTVAGEDESASGDGGDAADAADGGEDAACQPSERFKGTSLVCWYPGCFQVSDAAASLDHFKELGGNWLAIIPTWYQETARSSLIYEHSSRSPTTEDIRSIVALAREKGFKILLKPHVDIRGGGWRGNINPDNLAAWQSSYRDFLLHFARLAEELQIEVLSVGTELKTRSGDTTFWNSLIGETRIAFGGDLTYAANWDEYDHVAFWDALDFIGIDFYFPLTDNPEATVQELEGGLAPIRDRLSAFSAQQSRPFIFTEIGYRSVNGTVVRPYDFNFSAPLDLQEQADAYESVLTVFGETEDWLDGIFWWRWDPRVRNNASDEGYLIDGKPAAEVLARFWTADPCAETVAAGEPSTDEPQQDSSDGSTGSNSGDDGSTNSGPDSGGTQTIPSSPSGEAVSFVTFGDWGSGRREQRDVAAAMGSYCRTEECEFVLTLGDNIYSNGVQSTTDVLWDRYYRQVYGTLGIPFYAALGNHDTYGNIQAEIDYSNVDSSWHMPAENYSLVRTDDAGSPLVEIFVINSQYRNNNNPDDHFWSDADIQAWLEQAVRNSQARWKFLAMHHPIYGSGGHGNWDQGRSERTRLLGIVCGQINLVLSGHNHNFAHMRTSEDGCPVEQLVVGTGGQSISNVNPDPRMVEGGDYNGFGWLQVTRDQVLFRMVRSDGMVTYSTTWTHP